MAVGFNKGGEMQIVLRVKDDGTAVIEDFGETSEDAFNKTGKSATKAGQDWKQFGKDAKKYSLIAVAAATAILAATVQVGAGFEQSIANVGSVANASEQQLKTLSRAARDQAKISVFTASQVADAQYFLASAGLEVNQVIDAQTGVMNLAAATQSDLAQTSEIVTASLAQFGLAAESSVRVANVYSAAISGSQATMQKLGDAMRYVGPVANALDQDIESTTAAIALLFNAGFKGEQAGTILRASLIALQKPSKEAADVIENVGLKINNSNGTFVGFESIIDQLAKKQLTLNEAATIFGAEAAPGMLALVKQGSNAYRKMRDEITGTNRAQEMANRQTDTLTGDWKFLTSALEESSLILFDEIQPALRAVTQAITGMVSAMNDADSQTSTFGKTLKHIGLIANGVKTIFDVLGTTLGAVAASVVLAVQGEFTAARNVLSTLKKDIEDTVQASAALADKIWSVNRGSAPDPDGGGSGGSYGLTIRGNAGGSDDGSTSNGRGGQQAEETVKLREELATQVELLSESWMTDREFLEAKYADEQILLQAAWEQKAVTDNEFYAYSLQSKSEYEKASVELTRQSQSSQYKLWESGWKGKMKVTSDVLGMIGNLQYSNSKKQFDIAKKANIAKTVIDTYSAAVGSYNALASIPFIGPVLGAAAAAAAVLYGKAQVDRIKGQQFGGGAVATATFAASPTTGLPSGGGSSSQASSSPSPFASSKSSEETQQASRRPKQTVVIKAEGSIDPVWMQDTFIPIYEKLKRGGAVDVEMVVAT